MNISTVRALGRFIGTTGILGLAFIAAGCTEMTVNTLQSRNAGMKEYNEGQYAEAAGTFRLTLRSNPADYPSHYFLGASLAHLGAYEQAIEQYKTTLELMSIDMVGKDDHPFRLQALNSLAEAVVASKDHDLQSVMLKRSTPAENQFLLAKIERGNGDADAALEAYSLAMSLAPNDFDITKDYGLYLVQLSQKDKARVELRRAYALNSKDPEIAAALRQVGVVPGPSLKNENDLVRPIIPVGPIPEVQLTIPAADNSGRSSAAPAD